MNTPIAQAIILPGPSGTPIPVAYPSVYQAFQTQFPKGTIADVIIRLLNYVFVAAGMGLLLMLISAGFSFLTSAGDAKKLEAGKQRLTNAVIGFLIVFVAYWIVQLTGIIFGFGDIQSIFPLQ
jgi:hypothetical protein